MPALTKRGNEIHRRSDDSEASANAGNHPSLECCATAGTYPNTGHRDGNAREIDKVMNTGHRDGNAREIDKVLYGELTLLTFSKMSNFAVVVVVFESGFEISS